MTGMLLFIISMIHNKYSYLLWIIAYLWRWEKYGALLHWWREYNNGAATLKNSLLVPQNFKYRLFIRPSNSASWYVIKRNETCLHKNFTRMFTVTLFMAAKRWKQPKCSSAGSWINQMWSIHSTEFDLSVRRNGLLTYTVTWRSLQTTC